MQHDLRAIVLVLDSVGIGQAPDAGAYGDTGAYTLQHTGEAAGSLSLPCMTRLGLGNIPALLPDERAIPGVPPVASPDAAFGAMQERSEGKDTTTGHWEIAGLHLEEGFHRFPAHAPSFPDDLLDTLHTQTGRDCIGNRAASGTDIIAELGEQHMRDGSWIVYTSADSVMQIAAHEDVIPLDELYAACTCMRQHCDAFPVGRVIARPFVGQAGSFTRTKNRRDFSFPPPAPTILDHLSDANIPVTTVGKLDDIFAHRGMTDTRHVENNADAMQALDELLDTNQRGFIFVNFIDFDMAYGHRRDPAGYAACLADTDHYLDRLLPRLDENDLFIMTADHGNDPTFHGTDHTREFVPVLATHSRLNGRALGLRQGFFDVAATLADFFDISPMPHGRSFFMD